MAHRKSLLLSLFCVPLCQSRCSENSPITIPITDVTLESGNSIRGVWITAGSPPQNLSLIPQVYLNNTWVYNASTPLCPENTTDLWCTTYRGGLYDSDKSSSAERVADVYAAGASPSDTDRTVGVHIWDSSWTLDDLGVGNITIDEFPVGMPGFDFGLQYHPQGALGLGQNSTLLSTLKEAGHINSRSYGFWWGEDGATSNAQMDGSIILGGYDAAKTQGSNITLDLKTPSVGCMSGMWLSITDIVMRFPNSTRSSIVAPSALLPACLHLDFPAMLAFPRKPYYDRFEADAESFSTTNSLGVEWWNPLYDPSTVYQGNLIVTLDNGMELTLPNELLVVPDKSIDDSGEVKTNSTFVQVLIQPTLNTDGTETPMVGKQFFSSTYLFVDHDAGTFTIWQANGTSDSRLVSVGGDCDRTDAQEDPRPSTPSDTPSGASDSPQTAVEPEEKRGSLSTGAMVGVIVGAVGALAAIAIMVFICCVRRKKRRQQSEKGLLSETSGRDGQNITPYFPEGSRHELHNAPTSELAAPRYARELDAAKDAGELDATKDARELDGGESKYGFIGHKSRDSRHQVYELGPRSPQ